MLHAHYQQSNGAGGGRGGCGVGGGCGSSGGVGGNGGSGGGGILSTTDLVVVEAVVLAAEAAAVELI